MSDTLPTTYRVVCLGDRDLVGDTAKSENLARLVASSLPREMILGMERTDWKEDYGKLKPARTVLIDAESSPGEWDLGG